jgi:hypothetical protein
MLGKLPLGLVGWLLVGCGASSSPVNTPSGGTGYEVECGNDRQDCLTEAGDQCGYAGYRIISEDSHWAGVWTKKHSMTVECGRGDDE